MRGGHGSGQVVVNSRGLFDGFSSAPLDRFFFPNTQEKAVVASNDVSLTRGLIRGTYEGGEVDVGNTYVILGTRTVEKRREK